MPKLTARPDFHKPFTDSVLGVHAEYFVKLLSLRNAGSCCVSASAYEQECVQHLVYMITWCHRSG